MLSNLIKSGLDRDYILVSKHYFNLLSDNKDDYTVRSELIYLNGETNVINLEETNLFEFWILYGNYMVFWLAEIIAQVHYGNRNDGSQEAQVLQFVLDTIPNTENKRLFIETLDFFSPKVKNELINGPAILQFKMNKFNKNFRTRLANVPISMENWCNIYLFVVFYDYLCRNYALAYPVLELNLRLLIREHKKYPIDKIFILAGEICAVATMELAEKLSENKRRPQSGTSVAF